MVTSNDSLILEIGESELLVEEFRQKLIFTLKKEREIIKEKADADSKKMLAKAYEDSAAVTKAAKDEAFQILTRAKQEAERTAERQLAQTNIKTQQLLEETSETIRREAKEKTKENISKLRIRL